MHYLIIKMRRRNKYSKYCIVIKSKVSKSTGQGYETPSCCIVSYCMCQLIKFYSWWRHQMETFSALLALCTGNSAVTGEFPSQKPVTRSFDFFSLICAWMNGWVNNREAGDMRRHRDFGITYREWENKKSQSYIMELQYISLSEQPGEKTESSYLGHNY